MVMGAAVAVLPALQAEDVRLDFPDTIELKALVDYLAATLGLNVIYDESQLARKVSLRVAGPVPRESLPGLLRTVLRSRGLALVPAEQADWFKIVPAEQLAGEGGSLDRDLPPPGSAEAAALTYVLPVRHADPEALRAALTPYLSKPGGTILVAAERRLLVLTDFVGNVRRVVEIAALLDVAPGAVRVETIRVQHQDPAELATTVSQLLADSARARPGAAGAVPTTLQPDRITGGLIAVGPPDQVARARALVEQFDQLVARSTELYQPKYLTAARLRTLVEQLLPAAGAKMAADEPSNTLIVTARPEVHVQVRDLLGQFDTAPPESATPLRFYKLLNRRADDVFATIGMLLTGQAIGEEARSAGATAGAGRSPAGPGTVSSPASGAWGGAGAAQVPPRPATQDGGRSSAGGGGVALQGEGYALALDEHTNSIIVMATPELHQQVEKLIRELDRRRPQVLVEVTLVSVNVNDSLNLGVELQTQKLGQPWGFELFSSFGLSEVNATTGTRRLNVLPGGTGVLLAPDEVPIILQALANSGQSRVYSAPRILVDDNATGSIESVAESPYTSVNASDTVATTSFAGFAKAGTQLTIQPHIAEGDHLEINYTLTVSSFTGAGTGTAPPPRSSDMITSTIRVPDGHTVIVGGLLTETLGQSSSHVPLIGKVPILGLLFGTNSESKSKVRLYAFIRPTVLRQEGFEDLKYLSKDSLQAAGVPDGFPPDRWQWMH